MAHWSKKAREARDVVSLQLKVLHENYYKNFDAIEAVMVDPAHVGFCTGAAVLLGKEEHEGQHLVLAKTSDLPSREDALVELMRSLFQLEAVLKAEGETRGRRSKKRHDFIRRTSLQRHVWNAQPSDEGDSA
ncbi:hypothetical protein UCDDS831_g02826 [Diplodia seriata]|uniref:Uncharacterized protein n=1 Tax=Diplodia seriata TaxID=420778 RepID=A0A0G2H4Y3_9PEZI|nr:hypothetical protein UCDDS831_g02826 [Diplodia seriata]